MEPSTSHPFGLWGRSIKCAEAAAPEGCMTGSFLKLECHTEPNEFGVPVKRCIRLHKSLVRCPGEPPVLNEHQEVLTLAGEGAQMPLVDPAPFSGGGAAAVASASARAGEGQQDLEELLRLADELQDKFLPGGELQLDPEPQPEPRQHYANPEPARPRGFLSGLMGRWQARHKATLNEKTWADYAKEFQEV